MFIYLTCACRFWVLTLIIYGINCRICHMFAFPYRPSPLRTPLPHCTKSCIFERFFHSFLIPSAMRTLPWVHTTPRPYFYTPLFQLLQPSSHLCYPLSVCCHAPSLCFCIIHKCFELIFRGFFSFGNLQLFAL